jgi:hypothetical protein
VPFDRELIEAKLALDLIASAEMPDIAFQAWENGLDGKALSRLGALDRPTYFEVADVLPRVMKELGLSQISREEAALRMARRIAQEILQSGENPLHRLRDFQSLWIKAGYPHAISGLGTLYDDVWVAECTGQPEIEIRKSVVSVLKTFLRSENNP